MSATGLGSATGGASGTEAALRVDVEEDAELCADNDKDDDAGGCDEESEEDDDENDEGEDFESPANTTAATNNNDNKDNRGSRTKRPPSILTSNTLSGSIQSSVSEMPGEHIFREQSGML
jgi:hypothetical protein